jgi:hypothetical protein
MTIMGNRQVVTSAFEKLRDDLATEFYSQKEALDCSELEYYEYYQSHRSPSIKLNGVDLDISFTQNNKLVSEHKTWGRVLIDADFSMKELYKVCYEISGVSDLNLRTVINNHTGFGKEKVYLEQICDGIEDTPLIYNGRATQKTMGYYFDKYNKVHGYSEYRVRMIVEPLDYIFPNPTDTQQIEKLVTSWLNIQAGKEFNFMVEVVKQYFTKLRNNCIDCNMLSEKAKEAKYNFRKERNITPTYTGELNVYEGILTNHRRTFTTDQVEENADQLLVYTIGRNTNFCTEIHQYDNMVRDYKVITDKYFPLKVKFIRFNQTDMKKKALKQFVEEAENILTEQEFVAMICEQKQLWKTVYRYVLRNNFAKEINNLRSQIYYNNTTEVLFAEEYDQLGKMVEKMRLKNEPKRWGSSSNKYSPLTNFNHFDLDCMKRFKTAFETVNSLKADKVKDIENRVEETKKLAVWCNFLYSKEAYELAKPILKAKGVTFTEDQEKKFLAKLK